MGINYANLRKLTAREIMTALIRDGFYLRSHGASSHQRYQHADGRRVTARLRHPTPDALEPRSSWRFRATEADVADHINNAAYWQPLEEELLSDGEIDSLDVEMEFRSPAQPGKKLFVRSGRHRWIVDPSGELHASIALG